VAAKGGNCLEALERSGKREHDGSRRCLIMGPIMHPIMRLSTRIRGNWIRSGLLSCLLGMGKTASAEKTLEPFQGPISPPTPPRATVRPLFR